MNPPSETRPAPRIGLFVTCLANVFRPGVAESTLRLLQQAGCTVEVPLASSPSITWSHHRAPAPG